MATSSSFTYQSKGILQSNENYIRIMTMLNYSEMKLYYKVFHDVQYGGFTTDPAKLYKQLKTHDMEIQALLNQKLITKDEYKLVFPESEETHSQEFTTNLFYALAKHCVKKFPPLLIDGESPRLSPVAFANEIENLYSFNKDKRLQESVNTSQHAFDESWNEIVGTLKTLSYDINKLNNLDLKNGDIEANKKVRFSLLKSQVTLLTNECTDLIKTTEVNSFALNKLLSNFNAAVSESQEEVHNQPEILDQDVSNMNLLRQRVLNTSNALASAKDELDIIDPLLKCWREKNIEGDIIILDNKLSKLKNDVSEESSIVANMFSAVSLDIVKIKERSSLHIDNPKFIVSPEAKRDRSDSRLSSSRDRTDSKMTCV